MELPTPNISENILIEMEVLEPVIANWIETTTLMALHQMATCVQVQIIDIRYDIMLNRFDVQISDGHHFVTVQLDQKLNRLINSKTIQIFDIIDVIQSVGHPAKFSVVLVRVKII